MLTVVIQMSSIKICFQKYFDIYIPQEIGNSEEGGRYDLLALHLQTAAFSSAGHFQSKSWQQNFFVKKDLSKLTSIVRKPINISPATEQHHRSTVSSREGNQLLFERLCFYLLDSDTKHVKASGRSNRCWQKVNFLKPALILTPV